MYRWIVFVHIASVLGLLLVHPVTVAFHLKEERNDTRIRELLEVSEAASILRWIFFGITLASGILLGFMGSFWGTFWIWAALVAFIAIAVVMNVYGGRTIDRIRRHARRCGDGAPAHALPPRDPRGHGRGRPTPDPVPDAVQADAVDLS